MNSGNEHFDSPPFPAKRVVLLTAGLFLLINYQIVLGTVVPRWDADQFFTGYYVLVADFARAFRLLHWNPWCNAGSPDAFEPQVGALSPVSVLAAFVGGPSTAGFQTYWLFIWGMGGLGLLFLARHLKAPAWGAVTVSLGFMFSGFYLGQAQHLSHIYSFSFLPWILWRLDVALHTTQKRAILETGALLGLSGIGGYPGLAFANGLYITGWCAGRWLCRNDASQSGGTTGRTLCVLAVAGFVAAFVAAPLLVGFFSEVPGYSIRAGMIPYEFAVRNNAFPAEASVTLLTPYPESVHLYVRSALWRDTDPVFTSIYCGAAVLVLGFWALRPRRGARFVFVLFGLGLLFLTLSMGRDLPMRGWLYDLIPPSRYFRHTALFRNHFILTIAILALIGTRDLHLHVHRIRAWRFLACLAFGLLAGSIATIFYFNNQILEPPSKAVSAWYHPFATWGALCILAFFCQFQRFRRIRTLVPVFLVGIACADAIATLRISSHLVHGPSHREEAWNKLNEMHVGILDNANLNMDRSLRANPTSKEWTSYNLISKRPVLMGYSALSNQKFLDFCESPGLSEIALGTQRTWFAPDALETAPGTSAFEVWRTNCLEKKQVILVLHNRNEMAQYEAISAKDHRTSGVEVKLAGLPPLEKIEIDLQRYDPDEVFFSVTAPSEGWVLFTDRWASGWQATVNGTTTEVRPGCFFFRAVHVLKGPNEIRFRYAPAVRFWWITLSWAFLAGVVLLRVAPAFVPSRWRRSPSVRHE